MHRHEQVSLIHESDAHKIVLDNGSRWCRVGFAGADAPRSVFQTCLASTCLASTRHINQDGRCSDKMSPLERGVVTDWDAMEKIWQHAFSNELRVDPGEYSVLISDKILNPKSNRERMAEVMFERFNVQGFIVASSSVLSLYANGRESGLVIESGEDVSSVAPFYDGCLIQKAVQRLDFGGRDITDYLVQLLAQRGYSFATAEEWETVNHMKESHCYVSSLYEEDMEKFANGSLKGKWFSSEGLAIKLRGELIQTCEILFNPALHFEPKFESNQNICVPNNSHTGGIHEAVYKSVMKCEVDVRRSMFANSIVMSGGNTMIPGLGCRLNREVSQRFPSSARIRIYTPPERQFSTWIGGSIYASLCDTWLSRAGYLEYGPTVAHRFFGS